MAALAEVGYLPGELGLYPRLTGERTLDALARLHPRPPSERGRLLRGPRAGSGGAAAPRARVLARHEAEAGAGGGAAARPARGDPRRADLRPRPGDPGPAARVAGLAGGGRAHRLLLEPRAGGGRGAVRPGGDDPRRPPAGDRPGGGAAPGAHEDGRGAVRRAGRPGPLRRGRRVGGRRSRGCATASRWRATPSRCWPRSRRCRSRTWRSSAPSLEDAFRDLYEGPPPAT